MAVLRKEKKSNFTIIDNAIFRDYTLSMKAKGLLCQMLSLPDGWEWSVEGLTRLSTDGKSAITSGLEELKNAGYFRREQKFNGNKFDGYEYVISETKMSDFTFTENPSTENPMTENPPQLNTKESNTDLSNTKESIHTEFENLWAIYPRKNGKPKALGYYEKARKNGVAYEDVEKGIEAYKAYIRAENIEPRYVKMGSTFFSQRAWEDDWSIKNGRKRFDEYGDEPSQDGFGAEPEGWGNIFGA